MDGLMQPRPLTIAHLFERAETLFAHKRVIDADGDKLVYREWAHRVRRLVTALAALDVPPGARVATLAANHRRHLEVYAAAPISKRVLHTLNIRLSSDHLTYIIEHADDDVVFLDRRHLPLIQKCLDRLPGVRHWVVFPDGTDGELPPDPDSMTTTTWLPAPSRTRAPSRPPSAAPRRTWRPACATPPGRPGAPKVSSTATGRPCCTASGPWRPGSSVSTSATWSCRSSRCSTRMHGDFRTAR